MAGIKVEKPDEQLLEQLNVKQWSTWKCDPGTFPWHYDSDEVCYIHKGYAEIASPEGTVQIGKGDLVTFPRGLSCTWNVKERIEKVYTFK